MKTVLIFLAFVFACAAQVPSFIRNDLTTNSNPAALRAVSNTVTRVLSNSPTIYLGGALSTNSTFPWWPIVCWGDSFTAGQAFTWYNQRDDYVYPISLSNYTGRPVFNGGVGGDTSAQIKARALDVTNAIHRPKTQVIWAGRNDVSGGTVISNLVTTNISSIITNGNTNRYFVLSILNADTEIGGSSAWVAISNANWQLSQTFSNHYIEIREFLVNSFNTNLLQDRTDWTNNVPPTSLRNGGLHLNNVGYALVAIRVAEFISTYETNAQPADLPVTASDLVRVFYNPPIPLLRRATELFNTTTNLYNTQSGETNQTWITAGKIVLNDPGAENENEQLRVHGITTLYPVVHIAGSQTTFPAGASVPLVINANTTRGVLFQSGNTGTSLSDGTYFSFPGLDFTIEQQENGAIILENALGSIKLSSAGNVGIFTTTPTEKLSVIGNYSGSGTNFSTNGFACFDTNSPITFATSGYTNRTGRNISISLLGTALTVTKFETNSTQLFSWGAVTGPIKELLKPNQYITTSGTLTSNNVEPF